MTPDTTTTPPAPPSGQAVPNPKYKQTPPPPPGGGTAVPNVSPTLSSSDDSIPAFIRSGVDVSRIRQVVSKPGADGANVTAEVKDNTPNTINVYNPARYDANRRNHELTHVYQDSRSTDIPQASEVTENATIAHDPYDYSGLPTSSRLLPEDQQMQAKLTGLQKAINSGKNAADFNVEQQAEMVRDYKKQHDAFLQKVKDGTATKKDLKSMSELQNTYHPIMEQMAAIPAKGTKINPGYINLLLGKNMPTIDAKPDAPGLPSFDTAGIGVVKADPLMGGKSQPIRGSNSQYRQAQAALGGNNDNATLYVTPSYRKSSDMVYPGNVDIAHRPDIKNSDGSHSSVFSTSFGMDNGEVLVPGVGDGKTYPARQLRVLYTLPDKSQQWAVPGNQPKSWKAPDKPTAQNNEALDQYIKTGKNLGTFKTPDAANRYGQILHQDQSKMKVVNGKLQ